MTIQAVLGALILGMAAGAAPAGADECKVAFPLTEISGNGELGLLTLYNLGEHFELQIETPRQVPLQNFAMEIDGKAVKIYASPGLDDMLAVLSTDKDQLQVSDGLLLRLAEGKMAGVTAATLEGKKVGATFMLKSFVVNVSYVKAGCKNG